MNVHTEGRNTKETNEAFRQAWDATNARYIALCKELDAKTEPKEVNDNQQGESA